MPRTAARWSASSCRRSRPERQLELEAPIRILEDLAEELPQPGEPVADRLWVEVERAGHRRRVAAVLDERERRLLHPRSCGRSQVAERSQAHLRESLRQTTRLEEQQLRQVPVGVEQAVALDRSGLQSRKSR